MRTVLLTALLAILGAALCPAQQVKKLDPDELSRLLENDKNIFFLDVREPKEIDEQGTLKGYVNIPIGELEKRLSEVPKDKVIVTACSRAVRAGRAADLLVKNGYKVAGSCAMNEWKEKGKPVIYPNGKK
jgi:rhodanese-related sulfurtransferase